MAATLMAGWAPRPIVTLQPLAAYPGAGGGEDFLQDRRFISICVGLRVAAPIAYVQFQ
jgi:hypothetical protein